MVFVTQQVENSVITEFGLDQIDKAENIWVNGTRYSVKNPKIQEDFDQLRFYLNRVEENVSKLFQIMISASSNERTCSDGKKCCVFEPSSIAVEGGGHFHIKFVVKIAGVELTVDLDFTSAPKKLSYRLTGVCGEKDCESQQLSIRAFTIYEGKLTMSATGEMVFGKLKLGKAELILEIKSPGTVITQDLKCF